MLETIERERLTTINAARRRILRIHHDGRGLR
jgi:hypothetical protein